MLEVDALEKSYAGVQAVRGVSFSVAPGECVALIGPNGAGKSTTFACIAGQLKASTGSVRWCGNRLDLLNPEKRVALGVARTFQVAQVFEALTVWQNLALVAPRKYPFSPLRRLQPSPFIESPAEAQVDRVLTAIGLSARAATLAGELPYGDRKRLELGIALAGIDALGATQAGPKLLLLDEPAAGLAAPERQELMQLVRSLANRGSTVQPNTTERLHNAAQGNIAVLFTEHNMDAVFGVADRILVLVEGQIIAQGRPDFIAQHPLVQQRYLGQVLHRSEGQQHA